MYDQKTSQKLGKFNPHVASTLAKMTDFKILKAQKWIKININHLQDLKNVTKTIFNASTTNSVQNRIFKKKKSCQICSKILKIPDLLNFLKSQNGRKWPELDDNYSKTSALPQSLSKILCVSKTQKFMKIF